MPVTGPTVVRRQLGRRLRRLREESARTEQEVERAKVCSRTTLWRIENGKFPVKMNTVHGLLQTPDYMRAVFRAADPQASEQQIERLVSLRLDRQISYYDREQPARIVAVLGEGALAREVGGPAVMAEQRAHLASMGRRVRVEIRVLPWSAGAHAAFAGAFTVLDFADPDDPDVVYVESHMGARYLERPVELAEYRRVFRLIREQSVPIEEHLA
ncbi:DUF5753 domain-containing protein [Solwaraspora sp. WMMB335]|uniref:DUF5753 domain-containing protein n=1 Tax=Solwaraspora sp. WMMB335 TaxID=3404118 RepID=UPI003B95ED5A